jgi:ribA/ribD-fused uncharacterized protein
VTRSNQEPKLSNKPATGPSLQSEIRFYRSNDKPYGAFSNLFRRPIVFEGREYPTAEHAYQAGKARREAVREWILSAPSPSLVAMAAHGLYTWDIVPNWTQIKFDRMRSVLRSKFSQHEDLRALLLETGEARLVEVSRTNNPVNRVWGEVNGKGLNMLGVLLMEVRAELEQANAVLKRGRPKSDLHAHALKVRPADRPTSKRTRTATA